jgi:Ca2+-binding RTX toxin-like protein
VPSGPVSIGGNNTGSVDVTGTAADLNSILGGLTYTPPTDFFGTPTLTFTANDGGNVGGNLSNPTELTPLSSSGTVSITVQPINDAPILVVPGPQTLFNTDTLDFTPGQFQVADIDASSLEVILTVGQGNLSSTATTGLQVSGNNSLSVTLSGSVSNLNSALGSLIYDPIDSFIGTDTLTLTTSDLGGAGAGGTLTDMDTVTLTVTPPQVPFAASDFFDVDEDSTLTPIDLLGNDLRPDPTDSLFVTEINGQTISSLSSSASTPNGFLTQSGDTFTYTPNTDFFGTETFTYTIESSPGVGDGPSQGTVSISVLPINDGPINSVPGSQTINEDNSLSFNSSNQLDVSDVDAGSDGVTVTLTVSNGSLNLSDPGSSAVTGNSSGNVTIDGSVSQVNNTLGGLTYTPTLNFNGLDTLTIITTDNGNFGGVAGDPNASNPLSDTDTVNITIQPINDPPVLVVPGKQSFFTDFDNSFSSSTGNPISVSDVDGPTDNKSLELSVDAGVLTLPNTTGVSVSGNGSGTISILGDLNNIDNVLDQIFFNTSSTGNNTLTATLTSLVNLDADPNNDLVDPSSQTVEIEVLDFVPVDILGRVFVDEDGDGNLGAMEPGLDGVEVRLTGTDFLGNTVDVTAGPTDSTGFFTFSSLPASGDQPFFVDAGLDGVDPFPLVINRQGQFTPDPFNIPVANAIFFDLPAGGGDFVGRFDKTDDVNEFVLVGLAGETRRPIDLEVPIVIRGSGQDDNLTVDFTNFGLLVDSFEPGSVQPFEIQYDGGPGNDSLNTTGGIFGTIIVDHTNANSGTVTQFPRDPALDAAIADLFGFPTGRQSLDDNSNGVVDADDVQRLFNFGGTLTTKLEFENLEPLDMTGSSPDNLIINLPAGIDHDTSLIPHDQGVELVSNNGSFERTAFRVPAGGGALINFRDGNDVYDGTAANAGGIVVAGAGGNDALLGGIGMDVIFGEAGDDYIQGGSRPDQLFGGLGDDIVRGQGSDDLVDGGAGIDFLSGGGGNNTLVDIIGGDVIVTDNGYSALGGQARGPFNFISLTGSDGVDNFNAVAFSGNVFFDGRDGGDILQAGRGNDEIHGGPGNDFIYGFTGNDLLFGDDGNDYLQGANGDDGINGGLGNDIVRGMGGFDNLSGGLGNDRIDGGSQTTSLTEQFTGDATIRTESDGSTSLNGVGIDVLVGFFGSVTLTGDDGANVINAVDYRGSTNIQGLGGNDVLLGGQGRDKIEGGDGDDYIQGGAGADDLQGGLGNDFVRGQGAADIVGGGLGDDVVQGGAGVNQIREEVNVDLTVSGGATSVQFTGLGTDTYSGEFFRVIIIGGNSDNSIDASGLEIQTFIQGNGGDDQILGGNVRDIINAGPGNDFIRSGFGNDILRGGPGSDLIIGDQGNDIILGDGGNDNLLGAAGSDIILGGDGDDFVKGNGSFDILFGGTGTDNVVGSVDEIVSSFTNIFDALFDI